MFKKEDEGKNDKHDKRHRVLQFKFQKYHN